MVGAMFEELLANEVWVRLGAFAGVRVAFGLTTQLMNCGTPTPVGVVHGVDCMPLLQRLNSVAQTFGVGGVVAILCGGIGLWGLKRKPGTEADSPHA